MIQFTKVDIEKIGRVLGTTGKFKGNNYRFLLENKEEKRSLSLEIYPEIQIGDKRGALISVYTENSHLQLHFCTGYVVSDMLGEVTFVAECENKISGLTIERNVGCSLYANVDSGLLSGDFTNLGPEVMLSGIALSLTEKVLSDVNLNFELE